MNTTYALVIGVVLVLIVGGVFVSKNSAEKQMMNETAQKEAMMKAEEMKKEEMMKAEEMKKEEMMKEEAMMEKGGEWTKEEMDAMEKDKAMMDDKKMMEEEKMEDGAMMKKAGTYEAYVPEKLARASTGDVVLFFRASWCPTCRALDADIKTNASSIREGVTILDVNYDDSTALKQKYGVTYQHTLVQVDAAGNQIAKWTGSPTLAALLTNIK